MSGQQHRASRCVFVGNIPYDATEEQLVQICEEVGPVVSFRLVVDRDTGKPKGYGFCEFRDEETALSARRNLQGYEINGRQLRVDFAENEKGGGGVDRNREQGRGGPGYQQNPSHLDVKKEGGGGGHQSGFGGGGGAATLEPPIGRAAASEAALMMANALGGAQQHSNAMMQGQGPMQPINAAPSPITGNGGVPTANDTLTNHLASMSKHQLYEIMAQMKNMAQQNQLQVRQILVANPQLTKALFQAQIILGMVRPPQVAASQPPQAQQLPPSQQPGMQQQQQLQPPPPPRPLQPLAPPLQMQQQPNKSNFPPPLPQSQQQPLQQPQALPPQQQQQQPLPPPPHPQGSFQIGMAQTSLGMGFPQGPPPQAPNQPPPQQLYQMGSNMMTGNLPRMGTNSGGGMLSGSGTMGSVQMHRGPAQSGGLGSLDARGVQLTHGLPPSSTAMGGISGVHGQGHIAGGGHTMVSTAGSGTSGLGQSLQNNLAGPQMMGDPNGRGYAGLNPGLAAQMNSAMNSKLNSGLNSGMNAGMNNPLNSGMNLGMNAGMPQGLNQGYNAAMNMGMNQAGLHSNMNPGMNLGLSMGLNASQMGGLNASQGGFSGVTDGTPISTAALQSQGYPQQSQGQASMELEQQKALLQQVLNLTNEQIMLLPPDQRQQVLQLQQALR